MMKIRSILNNVPFFLIIGLAIAITTLYVVFNVGMMVGKKIYNTSAKSTVTQSSINPQVQQSSSVADMANNFTKSLHVYPSLDRGYYLYLYPISDERCKYGVKDIAGLSYDITLQLGSDTLTCSEFLGEFYSSFVGWADDNKLLFVEKEGEVMIVDILNSELKTHTYDSSKYTFFSTNRTLQYWLFRKKGVESQVSYILLDENNAIVLDNINFESNDRGVLYDVANDGFLFISRTFSEEQVSIKFDFLSLNNLALRNILTTEPIVVVGRGCIPEYLVSRQGEIILTQGCLVVKSKYIGSDGNIHIRLNENDRSPANSPALSVPSSEGSSEQ